MKDNYNWLDSLMDAIFFKSNLAKVEAKQTIISQIEIEKLRARIDEDDYHLGNLSHGEARSYSVQKIRERIEQLQEKLKELEGSKNE